MTIHQRIWTAAVARHHLIPLYNVGVSWTFGFALVMLASTGATAAQAATTRVVFLNFADNRETVVHGDVDDAVHDQSSLAQTGPAPAFFWPAVRLGTMTRRQVIESTAARVHELYLPYNVQFTTARPARGPYTMVLITGGDAASVGIKSTSAGLSYLDCDDEQPANVVLAFTAPLVGNLGALAVTIAHETGHAFGLEHSSDPEDLMFPSLDPRQRGFLDRQNAVAGNHHCGRDQQNSHGRLIDLLGAWQGPAKPLDLSGAADVLPPSVTFIGPQSQDAPLPQPFLVQIQADDDRGLRDVQITVGSNSHVLRAPPFSWSLAGLPVGTALVQVTATDDEGNSTTITKSVEVLETKDESALGCSAARGRSPSSVLIIVALAVSIACARRLRLL